MAKKYKINIFRFKSGLKKALKKAKDFLRGFTIVELIVVIAILGVLTSVILPAVSNNLRKGKDTAVKANVSQITKKIIIYYVANFTFPNESEWPETAGADYGFNVGSNDAFIVYGPMPSGCCWAQDSTGVMGAFTECPGPGVYSASSNDLFPC